MEALAITAGAIYVLGSGLLVGLLVFLPFWLVGRLCSHAGKALQENYGHESVPK